MLMQHPVLILILPQGELVSRARLEELRPENFSAILILADESGSGAIVDADSRSLAVQLLLRDIQARINARRK